MSPYPTRVALTSAARPSLQERTALALDEASPAGHTPQSVLDLVLGDHVSTLTWASGGATDLAIQVAQREGGAVEWVDYEVEDDGDGSAMEIGCADLLEIEVEIGFATADGAFDEQWSGRITSHSAGGAGFYQPLDAVAGTFDPWDHAPAGEDYDEVTAWVDLAFDDAGASGTVDGQGSGVDGDPNDPEGTAYAESFDIASFAPAEE